MKYLRELSCGMLALLASIASAWAEPVAQVVKLSGQAVVTRDDATAPAVLGAALEPGDQLTTDATGRVRLQLIDGSVINLGSQSTFSIDDVVSGGPGTDRRVELDLLSGALRAFATPATPNSRFEIRTPKAITAVRGTEWGILSDDIKSDILILSGRVGVRKNEISGASAISLTRSLGVTVSDAGLGQITRWTESQVAALLAATDVPGAEIPFDLGQAPTLNLEPLPPSAPQDQPNLPGRPKQKCLDPDSKTCTRGGQGSREQEHDGGEDHEHESDNGGSSI